jgi:hypothetical protein
MFHSHTDKRTIGGRSADDRMIYSPKPDDGGGRCGRPPIRASQRPSVRWVRLQIRTVSMVDGVVTRLRVNRPKALKEAQLKTNERLRFGASNMPLSTKVGPSGAYCLARALSRDLSLVIKFYYSLLLFSPTVAWVPLYSVFAPGEALSRGATEFLD